MRRVIGFALLAATLALGGCTTIHVDSPVGAWTADGDESGTLRNDADGTFSMTDASFNLISGRATPTDFNGVGTWSTLDDGRVRLAFTTASVGTIDLFPTSFRAEFRGGTIRFEDPDQTVGITFRLRVHTTSPTP